MSERGAILVDWGTTNLRAYLADRTGAVIDRRSSDQGILAAADRFAEVFRDIAGHWCGAGLPVVMSGMIGSRQGWVEAPYLDCPADLAGIMAQAAKVPDLRNAVILPGVTYVSPEGNRDVMRGEETKIFGALGSGDDAGAVLCLPGTHSKWAEVEGGRLLRFATAMTGELFAVLRRHSILSRMMPDGEPAHDASAFARGLVRSRQLGGLANHLFSVRAEALFGTVAPEAGSSYLSGILIGHEVAAMAAMFGRKTVTLVAGPLHRPLYEQAMERAGMQVRSIDAEDAVIAGLSRAAAAFS